MKKEHRFNDKKSELKHEVSDEEKQEIDEAEEQLEEDAELTTLREENQKLREEFLRTLAEAENVKKRCQAEIEKNNKYAVSSFGKDLLGVADNLQRAVQAAGENADPACEGILTGVKLTRDELNHVFAKFGIEPMQTIGAVFDPNFHQVVQEVEDSTKPAGTVVAELQTGYMINGRLLREAMVVVTKGGN